MSGDETLRLLEKSGDRVRLHAEQRRRRLKVAWHFGDVVLIAPHKVNGSLGYDDHSPWNNSPAVGLATVLNKEYALPINKTLNSCCHSERWTLVEAHNGAFLWESD